MLEYAIMFITMALVFYTVGVWSEKIQGRLKRWHLLVFWIGLLLDTAGTTIMSILAPGGFNFNFHGITGLLAILLMLFHALWATVVLVRNENKMIIKFHKLSIFVWFVWLVPYISGALFGMSR